MNLHEQTAQGVFWSAAANWGYQLTTLVVFAVLSRLLTPEAFGLVALASVSRHSRSSSQSKVWQMHWCNVRNWSPNTSTRLSGSAWVWELRWQQWDQSVPVMRVLAVAGLLQSILFVNNIVMKSLGKPTWRLVVMGITAVLLVVSFSVAVRSGIVAVAVAFAAVTYLMAPAWRFGTHRLIGLSIMRYLRQIGPPLGAALLMTVIVFTVKPVVDDLSIVWNVVVLVAVDVVTYTGALWFGGGRSVAREVMQLALMALPQRTQRTSLSEQ